MMDSEAPVAVYVHVPLENRVVATVEGTCVVVLLAAVAILSNMHALVAAIAVSAAYAAFIKSHSAFRLEASMVSVAAESLYVRYGKGHRQVIPFGSVASATLYPDAVWVEADPPGWVTGCSDVWQAQFRAAAEASGTVIRAVPTPRRLDATALSAILGVDHGQWLKLVGERHWGVRVQGLRAVGALFLAGAAVSRPDTIAFMAGLALWFCAMVWAGSATRRIEREHSWVWASGVGMIVRFPDGIQAFVPWDAVAGVSPQGPERRVRIANLRSVLLAGCGDDHAGMATIAHVLRERRAGVLGPPLHVDAQTLARASIVDTGGGYGRIDSSLSD